MESSKIEELLRNAALELEEAQDNERINRILEDLVTSITGAEYASIWMNEYPDLVRVRDGEERRLSMERKEGLLYRCFVTKEPHFYNYLTSEKGYVPEIDNPDSIRIKSKITIPLILVDRLIGIVTCYSSVKKVKNFSRLDFERFKAITPLLIDAVIKMQANRGRSIPSDRRKRESQGAGPRRRWSDTYRKIEALEERREKKQENPVLSNEIASIVHDIRTPANNLLGFLELLESQLDDRRLQGYLRHARQSAETIEELTSSILEAASIGQEEGPRSERVESLPFFADLGKIFSAKAYDKRIHYNLFIDPNLPQWILIDPMRTKRVLMNLLSNAIKFTPEEGEVELSILYRAGENTLHCSVRDSGIGIPPSKQQEIFQAFTQADPRIKERYGGTGLGLAITAEYLREMGGEIRLESEEGKGSLFTFTLPLSRVGPPPRKLFSPTGDERITILMQNRNRPEARNLARYLVAFGLRNAQIHAVLSEEKIPPETTHLIVFQSSSSDRLLKECASLGIATLVVEESFLSLRKEQLHGAELLSQYDAYGPELLSFLTPATPPRVLIVEDDPISLELVRTMLQGEHCEIDQASSGEEGLKKLEAALEEGRPYRLLFSDQNLADLSGREMLERYRALQKERGESAPLFAVSISGDPGEKEGASPFDAYATKPFRREEILSILHQIQHQNKE